MKTITISKTVNTAVQPSARVLQTAAMFGLGVDESHELNIVPPCEIPLPHLTGGRGIVFITGPSGSGKSTILTLIGDALERDTPRDDPQMDYRQNPIRLLWFDRLPPLPDLPLVDALDAQGAAEHQGAEHHGSPDAQSNSRPRNHSLSSTAAAAHLQSLQRVMSALSIAGLGDAFVMLRRPSELSDGQRYRLRLARLILETMSDGEARGCGRPTVILADEFGSTLDRITAGTVARNVRRWVDRQVGGPLSMIVATAHDDLLESLQPEVLVWKGLGDQIEVVTR